MEAIWGWSSDLKWYQKFVASLMYLVIAGDTGTTTKYLSFEATSTSAMTTLWNYFEPLGMILIMIYFCVDLSKTQLEQRGDMTIQSAFAPFLKLLSGLVIISQGKQILSGFLGMNNSMMNWIESADLWNVTGTDPATSLSGTFMEICSDLKLLQAIIIVVAMLIVFLLSRLCYLVIQYQAISRKIEMVIRGGLMPIAIGDVYKGLDSNGVRYMKKFVALCLWGLAMMATVQIGNGLCVSNMVSMFSGSFTDDPFRLIETLLSTIVFPLAEAGMASASKQVCMDVMGC